MLHIGILSRGPYLYSTRRLFEAGRERGHTMYIFDHTRCALLLENDHPAVWYEGRSLKFLDGIVPRIGASVTSMGASVIQQFEAMGVATPTQSDALLRARDKLRCLQQLAAEGIPVPKTIALATRQELSGPVSALGGLPVVVKLLESTHGIGVALVDTPYSLEATVDSFLQLHERVLLQEFIAEADHADTRVLIVDGEIVASMRRQARFGEFRSNLHRGATGSRVELGPAERELVRRVVDIMQLEVAGVDLIQSRRGPLVMEVNASPGLEGIETITGADVAGAIIRLVERRVKAR